MEDLSKDLLRVSRMAQLCAGRVVKKIQDAEDRRRNRIYQTEKMKAVQAAVADELFRLNQLFISGIDDDTLNGFKETLSVLEGNITAFLKQGE